MGRPGTGLRYSKCLALTRGIFNSVASLEDAIKRYIAHHNRSAKSLAWTTMADELPAKLSCILCVSAV